LSAAAFAWWKRHLGSAGAGPKKAKASMPSSKHKCRGDVGGFLEVALPENGDGLELGLTSGRTLRFDAGIGRESLTTILSVLRELELC
jgi:hypothetical protein